jgi:lipopolysaccharide export system permease protein
MSDIGTVISITSILLILIWFTRAVALLNYVTDYGIKLSDFFYLFILILPWILIYVLPISFLISLIVTIYRFNINNETIVLKNSGLSNYRIAKPFIILGLLLSIISYFLSLYLMPYANKELRISRQNFKENYSNVAFDSKTFEIFNNITIYCNNRNENKLYGILINDSRNKEYSLTITASQGSLLVNNGFAVLFLKNGSLQRHDYEDNKTEILKFDSYNFNLSENNKEKLEYKWKPNERLINELFYPELSISDEEYVKIKAEMHKRFNDPLISLIFSAIVCALMINHRFKRNNNFYIIFITIAIAIVYMMLLIVSYRLNDVFENAYIISYLINLIFLMFSLIFLKINLNKIS